MPTTVDSPGAQMPIDQLSLDATPKSTSPFGFLGGFVGGLAAGAALVYSLVKKTGQQASNEAKKLELGALAVPRTPMSAQRRVVVNMSAAGAFHGQPKVKAFS